MYALFLRYIKHVFGCRNNQVNPTDWNVQHTSINFTKRYVPFTHKLVIKPIYDNNNQLMYLMGITYNNIPPINVTLFSQNLNEIKDEMECLTFACSLTKPVVPFNIVHVNTKWVALCGYSSQEMLDNTFKHIKGRSVVCQKDAAVFKSKILTTMICIILGIMS
jgi:hypothetical protein